MRQSILHIVRGAICLGLAATLSDLAGHVQVLHLDASTSALASAVLVAVASWLTTQADG